MIQVYCKNTGTTERFQEGTSLLQMLGEFSFDQPYPIVSAKVNHVSQGLKFRVYQNKDIEFVDVRQACGMRAYCRSLCFLLCKAAADVFPQTRCGQDGMIIRLRFPKERERREGRMCV